MANVPLLPNIQPSSNYKDGEKQIKYNRSHVKKDVLFKPIVRSFRQFLLQKFVEGDDIRTGSSVKQIKKQLECFMKRLNVPTLLNNSKT